jgi:hypothetical protein
MIRLSVATITDLASLRAALQDALRLEFFTIPPYLIAHHTLTGSSRGAQFARSVIRDIVRDEMLHMNLVCNILNAIGGTPDVRAAVPKYPNPLPMALAGGLTVHLKRYSRKLVAEVFMEIEKPETPIDIPVLETFAAAGPQTIGQFYGMIRSEIVRQTGDGIFTGSKERQVKEFFAGRGENIVVTDRDTALLAIDTIVEQGEGTPQSPIDLQHDIAHYYSFQQLSKAMQLKPLPSPHFDPAEPLVIDDEADVIRMVDDPQLVAIDPGDANALALSAECDRSFSEIVDTLHAGFSGDPEQLSFIDDTMRSFGASTNQLLAQPLTVGPGAGFRAGPRFLYSPAPRP